MNTCARDDNKRTIINDQPNSSGLFCILVDSLLLTKHQSYSVGCVGDLTTKRLHQLGDLWLLVID